MKFSIKVELTGVQGIDAILRLYSKSGEKLKADMDDLLDEIDEVLETNAEEFVKSYIQKGGQ